MKTNEQCRVSLLGSRMVMFVLMGISLLCFTTFSQEPIDILKFYRIETAEGNEFVGYIEEESNDYVKLVVEKLGTLTIYKSAIKHFALVVSHQIGAHCL